MALALVFRRVKAKIDTLELDASLTENHSTEIEVTDHPVEQGVNITDHRRRKPRTLTIEGLVSNTPVPSPTDVASLVTSKGVSWLSNSAADPTRAATAYQTLLDLCDASRLITVVTALQVYENMTIVNLTVPRDASTGQVLHFTATLREIRIVRNDTVTINAKTTRAQALKDLNKKTKTEATEDKRSIALQIQEDGLEKTTNNFIKRLTGGVK